MDVNIDDRRREKKNKNMRWTVERLLATKCFRIFAFGMTSFNKICSVQRNIEKVIKNKVKPPQKWPKPIYDHIFI